MLVSGKTSEVDIYIEVADHAEIVDHHEAIEGQSAEKPDRILEVSKAITAICATIYDSVQKSERRPNEITLEFGIKLAGKIGLPFVTEGSAEANFKVTAKWTGLENEVAKHPLHPG
jgi:hypothetical protein